MLRYYKLPSIKGEGWAHITINTDTGFFATVSDWGNYSYIWVEPGCEFREFLIKLQPDYLYGKLMMGRPDSKVWDEEKTGANCRQHLDNENRRVLEITGKGWAFYEEELETLRNRTPMDESSFEAWESETRLTDVFELGCYKHEPQCENFCLKIWPRFVELLKKELEAEKVPPHIVEMQAVEDAHAFAVMTGPDRNG